MIAVTLTDMGLILSYVGHFVPHEAEPEPKRKPGRTSIARRFDRRLAILSRVMCACGQMYDGKQGVTVCGKCGLRMTIDGNGVAHAY